MTDRLEIASRVLVWMVHEHNSPDVAARESLFFADALIAAHEATAPKAEALPDDAPVVEWEVRTMPNPSSLGRKRCANAVAVTGMQAVVGDDHETEAAAAADLLAVRAAATAYSAAKGRRPVFTGEEADHDR